MTCQHKFISCNKHTILVGDVDSGEGYACEGSVAIQEISALSIQFRCELKTALNCCF